MLSLGEMRLGEVASEPRESSTDPDTGIRWVRGMSPRDLVCDHHISHRRPVRRLPLELPPEPVVETATFGKRLSEPQ